MLEDNDISANSLDALTRYVTPSLPRIYERLTLYVHFTPRTDTARTGFRKEGSRQAFADMNWVYLRSEQLCVFGFSLVTRQSIGSHFAVKGDVSSVTATLLAVKQREVTANFF